MARATAFFKGPVLRLPFSRLLALFWPKADLEHLTKEDLFKTSRPVMELIEYPVPDGVKTALDQAGSLTDAGRCTRLEGDLSIDPLSGTLLSGGALLPELTVQNGFARQRPEMDLTRHLRPKKVHREPIAVMFNEDDVSFAAFVTRILPGFALLDQLDIDRDVLCTVSLKMGMTGCFQDALNDGVFRPRPVEVQRLDKILCAQEVTIVDAPRLDAALYERARKKLREVYAPREHQSQAVFLCTGGEDRAARLFGNWQDLARQCHARKVQVLDPGTTPLWKLMPALLSADTIIAPDTGEGAAIALARQGKCRLTELKVQRDGALLTPLLATICGQEYRRVEASEFSFS